MQQQLTSMGGGQLPAACCLLQYFEQSCLAVRLAHTWRTQRGPGRLGQVAGQLNKLPANMKHLLTASDCY
jgi:hypothetical protein